ncbi:EBNA-1 nuclear protein [Phaeobacter sp. 11ANDIMAR09]|nr:EBNA-1 nuclear protein [Phaeobacter sp. 11ANDIMAR09]
MSETTHNTKTAIVYCEGNFAEVDGKTANGLVRHSETYEVLAVIDSKYEGQDSGQILDGVANQIPVLGNLHQVKECQKTLPQTLIYGMAPSSGTLSKDDRKVILDAISLGMNIVIGLHEYLSDDFEIANAASANNVTIRDIRKPKASKDLRLFDGTVASVPALRIALLGTDCAIGKRTTATLLTKALNDIGIRTVLIGTGQTGLMQGARYGVAMDAVPPQYCCGELEGAIIAASESENPKVIIVEGQGALSHPAFCTSAFILRGSQPDAVILQHAPKRVHRCDFPDLPMPSPESEIQLIEAFSDTKVIGLTINHEGMSEIELGACIAAYSRSLDLPVTDPLSRPVSQLLNMVMNAFSGLRYSASTGAV